MLEYIGYRLMYPMLCFARKSYMTSKILVIEREGEAGIYSIRLVESLE